MKHLRLALEILGVAVYVAAHVVLVFVYVMGSSLRDINPVPYWAAIALGYVVMIALVRTALVRSSPRRAFDAWLLASAPAIILVVVFTIYEWPLQFRGWDGHGLGASGGEVNAALFPWMHALFWMAALAFRR